MSYKILGQQSLCNFPVLSKIRLGWAIYCHYDAIDPARRKFLHCLTLTKSSRSSSNRGEGIHGRIRVTWPEENFYRRPLNLVFFPLGHRLVASGVFSMVHRNLRNDQGNLDGSEKPKNRKTTDIFTKKDLCVWYVEFFSIYRNTGKFEIII